MALCEESQPHLLARVLRNQTRKMKTLSFFVFFFFLFQNEKRMVANIYEPQNLCNSLNENV